MLAVDETNIDFFDAVHVDFTSGICLLDLVPVCDQIITTPLSAGSLVVADEDSLEGF